MKLEISPSRLARSLTYMTTSFFFVWLMNTGKISHIVHPRMQPWIIAAGLLFLALSFFEMMKLSSRPHTPDRLSYFYPFAYVLAVAYLFVQATTLQPGRFQAGPESLATQSSAIAARGAAADKATKAPLPSWIVPDDDTYWPLYNRLYDNPASAIGKRITVQGFVYKEKRFPSGCTLVGRNLMWCCSADLAVIGYFAQSPALAQLQDNSWVEVTGRLRSIGFDMEGSGTASSVPLIEVESVRPITPSASTTIFPY